MRTEQGPPQRNDDEPGQSADSSLETRAGAQGDRPAEQPELAGTPASQATAAPGGQATSVYVNVAQPSVVVVQARSGESLLIRAIWFLFIGWWLGYFWAMIAWFLNLTIIGLPLGVYMLNRLPAVVTLRRSERQMTAATEGTQVVITETGPEQQPWWVRGIYFVLVGWWLSLLWIHLAYFLMVTIVGIPIAFIMFDYIAAITTLRRLK